MNRIAQCIFQRGDTRVVQVRHYERDKPSFVIEYARRRDNLGFPIWEAIATYNAEKDEGEGKATAMYTILLALKELPGVVPLQPSDVAGGVA